MSHEAQQRIKCACPCIDAGDCIDFRSGYDLRRMLAAPGDVEYGELDSGERCECACHDDDYDDDYEDDEP